MDDFESRLSKLEGKSKEMSEILEIVKQLTNDKAAVLQQDNKKYILDRSIVYQSLEKKGLSKRKVLSQLHRAGYLERDCINNNTRVTKIPDGKCKRVVVINLFD
jgi:hypothetical protein